MIRLFIGCFSLLSFFTIASTDFTYDGHYDADDYDVDFDLTYQWDGREITGGKIAFAQDNDGYQYMYIAHPLGFVDLSYGKAEYQVGWGMQNDGGNELKKIYDSEKMKFIFDSSILDKGSSKLNIKLNNKGKSTADVRTSNINGVTFYTTFDYNHSKVGSVGGQGSKIQKFASHSPKTISCNDENSSDPSCYALEDSYENKDSNGDLYDWDFNYGVEISLGKEFFKDLLALTADDFGFSDTESPINLASLHASDPKITNKDKHGQEPCSANKNPEHDPCGVSITSPTEVPEPSTLVIFALALGLLRIQAKRRNT